MAYTSGYIITLSGRILDEIAQEKEPCPTKGNAKRAVKELQS